jgi:hypothetical protein
VPETGHTPVLVRNFSLTSSVPAAAVHMRATTTKIHLAVAAAHDDAIEGFGPCHDGCTTWQPGGRGCKAWTREELFRRCEAEVANMPADTRSLKIARMHTHRDAYTLKTPARFGFIHAVEWIQETKDDLERHMRYAAKRGAAEGWTGMEIIHEAAIIWNRRRKDNALRALYAYGRIDRSEVNAAMAKHDFKSLWSELGFS